MLPCSTLQAAAELEAKAGANSVSMTLAMSTMRNYREQLERAEKRLARAL